jgi:hypothetical protein
MRRQRTLERVGWRFWRCFASSFYRDTEAVMIDLVETLTRMGIEPVGRHAAGSEQRYTEHRIIELAAPMSDPLSLTAISEISVALSGLQVSNSEETGVQGIAVGDKIVLLFSDDQKRISARLTDGVNDLEKGQLSVNSPLGLAIIGAEEGDEVELSLENGRQRKVLIESVYKGLVSVDAIQDTPATMVVA